MDLGAKSDHDSLPYFSKARNHISKGSRTVYRVIVLISEQNPTGIFTVFNVAYSLVSVCTCVHQWGTLEVGGQMSQTLGLRGAGDNAPPHCH